ncbi:hypothetical protein B4114_1325 [Geobacillus stearothermophilus]|uniref:Uncharacterized protein n=1 Tax=Geobacillus stearothermophilus TaxID=1422 RepID=A0A150NB19_GEOSE|nr:hypothetical protein B4114_1325 [Geobacillus stearothermophilus]
MFEYDIIAKEMTLEHWSEQYEHRVWRNCAHRLFRIAHFRAEKAAGVRASGWKNAA